MITIRSELGEFHIQFLINHMLEILEGLGVSVK